MDEKIKVLPKVLVLAGARTPASSTDDTHGLTKLDGELGQVLNVTEAAKRESDLHGSV